jgi:hypothetical protein
VSGLLDEPAAEHTVPDVAAGSGDLGRARTRTRIGACRAGRAQPGSESARAPRERDPKQEGDQVGGGLLQRGVVASAVPLEHEPVSSEDRAEEHCLWPGPVENRRKFRKNRRREPYRSRSRMSCIYDEISGSRCLHGMQEVAGSSPASSTRGTPANVGVSSFQGTSAACASSRFCGFGPISALIDRFSRGCGHVAPPSWSDRSGAWQPSPRCAARVFRPRRGGGRRRVRFARDRGA